MHVGWKGCVHCRRLRIDVCSWIIDRNVTSQSLSFRLHLDDIYTCPFSQESFVNSFVNIAKTKRSLLFHHASHSSRMPNGNGKNIQIHENIFLCERTKWQKLFQGSKLLIWVDFSVEFADALLGRILENIEQFFIFLSSKKPIYHCFSTAFE